jgi:integrase
VTPDRTHGASGNLRCDLHFGYIGRVRRSLGTTDIKEFRRREALLVKLWKNPERHEVLKAFKSRQLSIEQLVEADRSERLGMTLSAITLRRNLWDAVEKASPSMGEAKETRKRYATSFRQLQVKARRYLGDRATIADLARVPWKDLKREWGSSGTDWMHLRRAVSRFLTIELGDEYHPFRRAVMKELPTAREIPRKPDVSIEQFRAVVAHARADVYETFWCLPVTGLRPGEACRVRPEHLHDDTFSIHVPGEKTSDADEIIRVDPRFWPMVRSGLPVRCRLKWLEELWSRACKAAKVSNLHLHDLRHCHGQWAVDAGVAESKVQASYRHRSAGMTRRYVLRRDTGDVSRVLADVLIGKERKRRRA